MMRRIAVATMFLSGIAVVWVSSRGGSPRAAAQATVPTACRIALAAGSQEGPLAAEIARAQQDARGGPYTDRALERLGYLYVSRARTANDPGDYRLAEAAADCLHAQDPESASPLLLRGHVLHQLHRFREAEGIARELVARREYALDHGLLGDALMEQGRLTEAAAAYQKMADIKPSYQSYTRAAHLRWLRGDLEGAIDMMRLATGAASPRDRESSAWAWTRLSAYELQAGRLRKATAAVEAALSHQPDYAAALLAQGRILLAGNRPAEAAAVLERAAQRNPLPEYQWLLADALRLAARDDEARAVEAELMGRGATEDPRTVALFLATRGIESDRALALAEEELRVRGDVFTLDAHAWALAAAGRLAEASEVMERVLDAGTRDARLFLHAGIIDAGAGRRERAAQRLDQARRLDAMLFPSEAALLTNHTTATKPTPARKGVIE